MNDILEQFMRDRQSEVYEEKRTAGHDSITAQVFPRVSALLPAGAKVLDVGCGQGNALELFKRAGFDAIGIALNERDVEVCRGLGYAVAHCDQNDLSRFDNEMFDLVWARHVLEHSVAPFWTLHEFSRVAKLGAILYVEVPAPETACAHESNPNHYSVLCLPMWFSLIERSGFTVESGTEIQLNTAAGPDKYWSLICRKN